MFTTVKRWDVNCTPLRVEIQNAEEVNYSFDVSTQLAEAVNGVFHSIKRETIVIKKCLICNIGFCWNGMESNERFIISSDYMDEIPDNMLEGIAANIVVYKLREINQKDEKLNKRLNEVLAYLLSQ